MIANLGSTKPLARRAMLTAMGGAAAVTLPGCNFFSTDPEDERSHSGGDTGEREAPSLAQRVTDGDLPPLERRLPANPLVVEPLTAPGQYGGALRGVSLGLTSGSDLQVAMMTCLFRYSDDLQEVYPEFAEGYEFSDDYRTFVLSLREGVKWSDGEAFSADDVMFYFEDWQFNADLSPTVSHQWIRGDERMQVTKVDGLTVQFNFSIPSPAFGVLNFSGEPLQPYAPKHFLSQFHADYNPAAQEAALDEGYEDWRDHFQSLTTVYNGQQSPDLPVLDAWMLVDGGDQQQRYERNPYYWQVDSDGRQLPYIDELVIEYANDMEMVQLRAQSGEVSIAGRDLELTNYPLLKRGEDEGEYRATLLSLERGSELAVAFNMEHEDESLREIFRDVRFRRAASVAINRDQINQVVFLDQGVPRQATIADNASFFKQEWADSYAEYDPDQADQLLDEVGLTERDGDGVRLRPDGSRMSFQIEFDSRQGPKAAALERVVDDWRNVGLDVTPNPRDPSYLLTRLEAGQHDASAWHVDRTLERSTWTYGWESSKVGPGGNSALLYAYGWILWFNSDGEEGVEPPNQAKELRDAFEEWQAHEIGTPEYERIGTQIHDLIAENLWVIGTVGQGPASVLVKNGLENVFPEEVFEGESDIWWGSANWYWLPHRAQQWYWV